MLGTTTSRHDLNWQLLSDLLAQDSPVTNSSEVGFTVGYRGSRCWRLFKTTEDRFVRRSSTSLVVVIPRPILASAMPMLRLSPTAYACLRSPRPWTSTTISSTPGWPASSILSHNRAVDKYHLEQQIPSGLKSSIIHGSACCRVRSIRGGTVMPDVPAPTSRAWQMSMKTAELNQVPTLASPGRIADRFLISETKEVFRVS